MLKIRTTKLRQYRNRGPELSIPRAWMEDNRLSAGDMIDIYRDGQKKLVLIPRGNNDTEDVDAR